MGFDYGYTCPDIDAGIDAYKSDIEVSLSDMLDECNPLMEGEQKEKFIKSYSETIFSYFESNFEGVRESNENMRKEAEIQIEAKESEIETLEEEILQLKNNIEEIELI